MDSEAGGQKAFGDPDVIKVYSCPQHIQGWVEGKAQHTVA